MKTLVIVDMQQDFYSPDGNLYVKGGETIIPNIIKYIKEHKDEIVDVIFTLDWHPNVPAAFVDGETIWPRHCVQYTAGAGISNELLEACVDNQKITKFFIKGNTVPHVEYGAFASIGKYETFYDNEKIAVKNLKGDCHLTFDTNNIVVCGIAGDYCVLHTLKNLVNSKVCDSIELLESGVVSIDGTNEKIKNYCQENNVNLV